MADGGLLEWLQYDVEGKRTEVNEKSPILDEPGMGKTLVVIGNNVGQGEMSVSRVASQSYLAIRGADVAFGDELEELEGETLMLQVFGWGNRWENVCRRGILHGNLDRTDQLVDGGGEWEVESVGEVVGIKVGPE